MTDTILSALKRTYLLLTAVLLAAPMVFYTPVVSAQTAGFKRDFNHNQTGFPLTGAHVKVECETCHTGGVFKGTPTDCAGCHTAGRRVVAPFKSVNHMPTNAACNTCHTQAITFLNAKFNHVGVQPKACMTCHNGKTAIGKPNGHPVTNLSCDSCHRTSAWLPPGFDHAPPLASCITCHIVGGSAKGMNPATHVPTSGQSCDACHKNYLTFLLGATYDHVAGKVLPGSCATCHVTGKYGAKTKVAGHIPTGNVTCDSCHIATDYLSFAGSTMSHTAVTGTSCITCHNGTYVSQKGMLGLGALPKKVNHITTTPVNADCNISGCHSGFQTFAGLAFNHVTANPPVAGNCRSCHNGAKALGPTNSTTHTTSPGSTASCETCHLNNASNYTTFIGNATFTHTAAVYSICGTCHLGQTPSVVTKTPAHIPVSTMATPNACDTCHARTFTVGGFAGPTMNHNSVTTIACLTCHNGSYAAQGKNLGGARGMPNGHVVTNGAACSTCHTTTSWIPASYSHAGVLPATCGTCHIPGTSGALTKASRKTHIPVTGNACDACHNRGYIIGGFANATMYHPNVATTRCDTCHNGSYLSEKGTLGLGALAKPLNHIPTTITGSLDCSTCHIGTTVWTNEKMNHNGATTGCKTCHDTSANFLGNMIKRTIGNHETSKIGDDCSKSGCHQPTGTRGTSWVKW